MAMDDIRGPAELLDGLQYAAGKEDCALCVVFEELAGVVICQLFALEEVFVVYEVYLEMLATFITIGRSTSLTIMFIPERRMTSWSWFLRSLMLPQRGMKERISFLRS